MIAQNYRAGDDNITAGIDYEKLSSMVAEKVVMQLRHQPKFLTRKQLATMTGLGMRTIDRWKSEGKIPFENFGSSVRFPLEATLQAISQIKDQQGCS